MIAPTLVQQLRAYISNKIDVHTLEDGAIAVDVPLSFPDGDQCRIVLSRGDGDHWTVSDDGAAVMRASYANDVDIRGKGYAERFRKLVEFYGLTDDQGELKAMSAIEEIGTAVFTMAQASLDAVQLARLPKEHGQKTRPDFSAKLAQAIRKAVSERSRVARNWHDTNRDQDKLYPVTYRIAAKRGKPPIYLFGVTTNLVCMHATMACLFHKKEQADFIGISVFQDESVVARSEVHRLKHEVTRSFASLDDGEEITDFIAKTVG